MCKEIELCIRSHIKSDGKWFTLLDQILKYHLYDKTI